MKLFILFTNLMFSTFSFAALPVTIQHETLSRLEINGKLTPYVSVVDIDSVKQEIRLNVYKDACRQFYPNPLEVTCLARAVLMFSIHVPLLKHEDYCGSQIFSGANVGLAQSEPLVNIEVVDHSRRVCKDIVPGLMEVSASIFDPKFRKTTKFYALKSYSEGSRLVKP